MNLRAIQVGLWAAVLTDDSRSERALCGTIRPCIPSPYVGVARCVPDDYLWLIPGILLAPIFVVLMASIHAWTPEPRRIFSRIALAFTVAYAVVIGVDYFVLFAVVIPSLQSGETEGLSLFTQYNPHGLFIAGEALGYLMMSVALLFAAPVFAGG